MPGPLNLFALICALIALLFLFSAFRALRRWRVIRLATHLSAALVLLSAALLVGGFAVATRGYQALTREDVVAVVRTTPTGTQQFTARIQTPDGRERAFVIAGDEVYVDAHILKWKPIANFLGLHTTYELDRIAGRYREVKDEQNALRTVFSLAQDKSIDLFNLRQRYALLAPLLDAEYGSATFVSANEPQTYEILISTTGLLARQRIEGKPAIKTQ